MSPKTFRNSTERTVARARGHLRAAENFNAKNSLEARDFAVDKARIALEIGVLEATARMADAEELLAITAVYNTDAEAVSFTPDEWFRIETWMKERVNNTIASKEESEDEDPS